MVRIEDSQHEEPGLPIPPDRRPDRPSRSTPGLPDPDPGKKKPGPREIPRKDPPPEEPPQRDPPLPHQPGEPPPVIDDPHPGPDANPIDPRVF
jgi:hypothetical protein